MRYGVRSIIRDHTTVLLVDLKTLRIRDLALISEQHGISLGQSKSKTTDLALKNPGNLGWDSGTPARGSRTRRTEK